MARLEAASWKPSPNYTPKKPAVVKGLVLHITAGLMPGTLSWLQSKASGASSHFLNCKDGRLIQLVDTDHRAWTQGAGNSEWISIENEGKAGDALTDEQIENCARVLRWLHENYGVPLQVADTPLERGLGWHGMGGKAWGNHPHCPGEAVKAQRTEILRRAMPATAPTTKEASQMLNVTAVAVRETRTGDGYYIFSSNGAVYAFGDAQFHGGANGLSPQPTIVDAALVKNGYVLLGADGAIYAYNTAFLGGANGHL